MGSTIRFLDPARPVDPGDVSAVARLGAQLGYPAGREEFERRLERVLAEPAGAVLLAEEEGVVVGWLHVQALASVVDEPYALISGLVVDETLSRVLLLHHRKLDRWLQPGGHCDGDAELAGVALKEASEESGMDGLRVVPRIVDLDIHEIPPYGDVPAHLHLDSRFVVVAPADAEPVVSDESHDLAYLPWDAAIERADDASARRLVRVVRVLLGATS